MSRPQVSGYRIVNQPLDVTDVVNIIESIPTLTKIGGICLLMGKFAGILAVPAVFIPGLKIVAIILMVTWGTLVFTSIILCSYDHFHEKKVDTKKEKVDFRNQLIRESPALKTPLKSTDEDLNPTRQYQFEELYESQKAVNLAHKIRLQQPY